MSKGAKIAVVVAIVVVVSISLFYTYNYFTLKWAYETNVDALQAKQLLEAATANTSDLLMQDDVLNNANANKGTNTTTSIEDYFSNEDYMNAYDQYLQSGYGGSFEDYLAGN